MSPRSRAIYSTIVEPITDGWKETELAKQLGRTPSWVSERLSELKQEIYLQNGIFPPLTEHDYATLKDSIRIHGVRQPVLLTSDLRIIDGRHRIKACLELGVTCTYLVVGCLTDSDRAELEIVLNAARRHLTRQQKRKLAEYELVRDPNRSNRRIAAITGIHADTVNAIRAEMAQAAQRWKELGLAPAEAPPNPSLFDEPADDDVTENRYVVDNPPQTYTVNVAPPTRQDTLGRRQPAKRLRVRPIPQPKMVSAPIECPCCEEPVEVWRTKDVYELRQP
jgi:hypothetical protein